MLHYSGGHLRVVAVPGTGSRTIAWAIAAIPRSTGAFAAGYSHRLGNPGLGIAGVILEYER